MGHRIFDLVPWGSVKPNAAAVRSGWRHRLPPRKSPQIRCPQQRSLRAALPGDPPPDFGTFSRPPPCSPQADLQEQPRKSAVPEIRTKGAKTPSDTT